MKFNFLKTEPVEILDFEKQIGVELVVEKKEIEGLPNWYKYLVSFEDSTTVKRLIRYAASGQGGTVNEAITNYCKEISDKKLMVGFRNTIRRFDVPTLCHTRKVEIPKEEKTTSRPSLGVIPKYLHDEKRLRELEEAISRRKISGEFPIPNEWIIERDELISNTLKEEKNEYGHPVPKEYYSIKMAEFFTNRFYRSEPFACDLDPLFKKGFIFGITQWLNAQDKTKSEPKERLFTKDEVCAFARHVWYNESMKDSSRGISTFFNEWKSLDYTMNDNAYTENKYKDITKS